MMKPSTSLSKGTTKMSTQTRSGTTGQVSTLYLATCGLLLVAAVVLAPAASAASKSGQRSQVVASGARPSSSSLNADNVASDKDDHRLALASSTTNAQLVPVRHFESESSGGRSKSRNNDLTIGQSNIANAKVHVSPKDMTTAAGHHYGGGKSHGKYYMYAESPKKGAYKMGFKRGNHKHMIERKESAHKGHVHGYFKWHDKKGKGSHKYEFKHYDKKGKHHHY